MRKQVIFEAKVVSLMFLLCLVFSLALLNFKEGNIASGIALIVYCLFLILWISNIITYFKSERLEDKS